MDSIREPWQKDAQAGSRPPPRKASAAAVTTFGTADFGPATRMPVVHLLPAVVRGHVVAFLGEFWGTFMFLFFAFAGAQTANVTQAGGEAADNRAPASVTSYLLYIALAFGFSLAVNAWAFFRVSGGLFNPAVTFAMCLIGAVPWFRGLLLCVAQMAGAMAAAGVIDALLPGNLLVATVLSDDINTAQGLFLEMFLTTELVFTIFMLAAEKHRATFLAPVGIELAGVLYTGGSLNPARSFAPHVINRDFPGYHWIYWLGPFMGSALATAFYKLLKALEYETATANANEKTDEDVVPPSPESSRPVTNAAGPDRSRATETSRGEGGGGGSGSGHGSMARSRARHSQGRGDARPATAPQHDHRGGQAPVIPAPRLSGDRGLQRELGDSFERAPYAEGGRV